LIRGGVAALLARSVACRCLRGFGRSDGLCALRGGGGCAGGQHTLVRWGIAFFVTRTVSCCHLGDFCRFCGLCVLFCGWGNLICTGTFGSAFLSVIWCLCLCRRRGGLCAFCAGRQAAFHDSHFPGGSARLVIRRWLGAVGRFAKLWLFVVVCV